ncbi:hypothetical protein BABA_07896 [Neobacillus bataviensis LMG 21833]|uniref:Uncharacterized protein n=1 Tax=Neobacillus bataviensis LMG 21833 TaxID=1117379 RepID=K6DBE2_9BACI|nr:hypothetical protein [Neobacillus bataviensis]EKN69862.1 hypothetical protein BABA_07896 [Neobacillus bataviensis LMG 21833]
MIKKITALLLGLMLLIPTTGLAATDAKIIIDMHYLVVSPAEDGSTNLMNMTNYTNTSSEEYKGDGTSEAVLHVTMPEGAKDLNFLDNKIAFKQVEKGFITTTSISKNQTMVLPYSYRMPKGKEINVTVDYPIQMMQILVPEGRGSIEVKGAEATSQGLFKFDDQNYFGYSIESLKENQTFTLVYNKDKQPAGDETKAKAAANEGGKNSAVTHTAPAFHNPGHLRMWAQSPLHSFNPHIFMIIMGAIIIAGISYFAYFRRKARLEEERLGADKEEKAFKLLMAKQKAIMDKIIELEETFGEGNLREDEYQAKLAAYKQHLVQVKLNLRNFIE